jgi:hypothetical protein
MAKRMRPLVVSTRATRAEKARIAVVAAQEGVSVSEVIHRLLMPEVDRRVREALGGHSENVAA